MKNDFPCMLIMLHLRKEGWERGIEDEQIIVQEKRKYLRTLLCHYSIQNEFYKKQSPKY